MRFLGVWKDVFGKRRYLVTAISIALLFYSLNIVFSTWRGFTEFSGEGLFGKIQLFAFLFVKFGGMIKLHSFISLLLISILIGILFSLILYKVHMNLSVKKKTKAFGAFGVFLAIFVPGCAACGVGLVSILGLGVGLINFLPFNGLELSIVSIVILGFATFKTTKEMYICQMLLPLNK